jgi:hypothetical protein
VNELFSAGRLQLHQLCQQSSNVKHTLVTLLGVQECEPATVVERLLLLHEGGLIQQFNGGAP